MQKYPITMIVLKEKGRRQRTEDGGRLVRRSLGEDGKTDDGRQKPALRSPIVSGEVDSCSPI